MFKGVIKEPHTSYGTRKHFFWTVGSDTIKEPLQSFHLVMWGHKVFEPPFGPTHLNARPICVAFLIPNTLTNYNDTH